MKLSRCHLSLLHVKCLRVYLILKFLTRIVFECSEIWSSEYHNHILNVCWTSRNVSNRLMMKNILTTFEPFLLCFVIYFYFIPRFDMIWGFFTTKRMHDFGMHTWSLKMPKVRQLDVMLLTERSKGLLILKGEQYIFAYIVDFHSGNRPYRNSQVQKCNILAFKSWTSISYWTVAIQGIQLISLRHCNSSWL